MTSREESKALKDLQELLASDLSEATPERLYEGIRAAELAFDQAQEWSGRLVAEVRRREIPWSKVVDGTGVPKATLDRRTKWLP